ncbi:hypothetical protein V1599_20835 [Enterobacter sp. ECC-175]|uniref:hypothetical protein n=1 Tax=Enterobacter sp. ECC-175 TaxID=3116479 RepID=UPI003754862C
MSNNSWQTPSFVAEEINRIHFDTLIAQAKEVVGKLSGAVWTDTTTHDPGITMLESLAYNVSDLSYRCLLPLTDLLTPEGSQPDELLFPKSFAPEQMLTISPLTEEDYRRGIHDLYAQNDDSGGHIFSDVIVEKEEVEQRFHYFYNSQRREFSFEPPENETYSKQSLKGGYQVEVRADLLNVNLTTSGERYRLLEEYLENHRNVGEVFRQINIANNIPETVVIAPLVMTLEVESEVENIAELYADIYSSMQACLSPALTRVASLDLSVGEYSGPKTEHGWINTLAPTMMEKEAGTILAASQLARQVRQIEGISAVEYISLDENELMLTRKLDKPIQCWAFWGGENDHQDNISAMLRQVTLIRKGIRLMGDVEAIFSSLKSRQRIFRSEPSRQHLAGRYRNLKNYTPATSLIPSLYNLQALEPNENEQQLHQFLLGFEQELASGCAGLNHMSALLDLNMPDVENAPAYGSQWPFSDQAVSDSVHAAYKAEAMCADRELRYDREALIDLMRYMLGYFGIEPVGKTLGFEGEAEYLRVLRGLIRCMPQVGYARAAIHTKRVSSVQRRIAGQLGIGSSLFSEDADIRHLPFYIVEHPLLLPEMPTGELPLKGQVVSGNSAEGVMTFIAGGALAGLLTQRHLIDLVMKSDQNEITEEIENEEILSNILVMSVSDDSFSLVPALFPHLRIRQQEVVKAANEGRLTFRFSNVWLKDVEYAMDKSTPAIPLPLSEDGSLRYEITTACDQPWPPAMQSGDKLIITRVFTDIGSGADNPNKLSQSNSDEREAIVESVDSIRGRANIILKRGDALITDTQRYNWCINASEGSAAEIFSRDRFSLTVSLLFRRRLIDRGDITPEQLSDAEASVRRIVQSELPAHIQAQILWLSDEQFDLLAETYGSWQDAETRLGADTLKLLRMLSIGMLPSVLEGIGMMKIPGASDEEALDNAEEGQWKRIIDERGLLYIPAD